MTDTEDDARTRIAALERALAEERSKVRALQEIGRALGSTLEQDVLVQQMLTRVTQLLDATQSTLFILEDESGMLCSRVEGLGHILEVRIAVGQGLPGWVAEQGRPLNVKDAYQDVRFDGSWDRTTGFRTTSTVCVPVKSHQGRTIGVLQVLNKRVGYFSPEDQSMLSALAAQAAVYLENSKLFLSVVSKNMELLETKEQLEQKVRELDVLFEIAQVSASAMALDDLLEGVLARAIHAIGADGGSILLSERDGGELFFRSVVGGDPENLKRLKVAKNEGVCSHVARTGQPAIVNDLDQDERHALRIAKQVDYRASSLLCVPLKVPGRYGALELLNKVDMRRFTEDDLKLASVIAGHVSSAISLSEARKAREQEDRLATIGRLLSGVVHDLRGPMTVIRGYAQMLKDEEQSTAREQYSGAILRQLETVNAMTHEVLAFARGDSQVLIRKVYLSPFFSELKTQLEALVAGKPIELQLRLTERGTALFDEHKIRRALHNLVRNAAQAIGDRPGHICIEVARVDGGALLVSCEDDGPGIPEQMRGRLFESFTSHGKPDGTGLGLAIVRKVAEDHGGSVRFESTDGHTVFTLVLPQLAPAPVQDSSSGSQVVEPSA